MKSLACLALLGAVAAMLQPNSASAQSSFLATGNDFMETCGSSEELESLVCLGYVRGYVTGHISGTLNARSFQQTWTPDAPLVTDTFCLPDGFNYQQVVDVILRFLEENPAIRHEPLGLLIHLAMRQNFPCSNQSQ
ncbi:MAG: Rap1a/Tai family immunity protein [Erythrobacter sp.]|uniref:Rap1a/Tai family immunity protein n=1 Tax=Erythrobacter sp. TaxID=1042 RepID=UPI003A83F855